MNSVFSEQILADKLSKLNSTQQCIETLSHWCIFHRSKADIVALTWDKQFHSTEMIRKIPLLYLANDILQNSKRKGNEFVNEFWKILPSALKNVLEKGDDQGKNVISRLVDIWEQRRVFGSHTQSLKDVMLGEELPPPLEFNRKRSRSVKIIKKDSRSIRTKLTLGSSAERIVSALHLVISENSIEDESMSSSKSVIQRIKKMEHSVEAACRKANDPKRKTLSNELQLEETTLKQCIEKLKSVEANRALLVSELRDTLREQESELENVRTQMQVAMAEAEEAKAMRDQLDNNDQVSKPPKKSAAAIAAEVADRLAASSSSQFIMSSVLSSFAAEEAKNAPNNNNTQQISAPISNNPTYPQQQTILVPNPMVDNTSYRHYVNQSSPFGYGNMTPIPLTPPMVNTVIQMQPPPMGFVQQPMSFRPIGPPPPHGMMYYNPPRPS
ncbi:regulation of nuclear pre-mRNA domain-containing protein 1B isoform X1 [Impatiens glandulifera]|uniref:regulation of nuclear pre-mRNA domain-containing protein 1B isoform X1 n=1 Tax=Impatiens glandulifera TaxID=253017 RepID=UPI001FB144BC|nr:regulation of nuclear pre-mRNA domain-containing protein 1B isoform X1 [Impatiens glandulifera]